MFRDKKPFLTFTGKRSSKLIRIGYPLTIRYKYGLNLLSFRIRIQNLGAVKSGLILKQILAILIFNKIG